MFIYLTNNSKKNYIKLTNKNEKKIKEATKQKIK